MLSRVIWLATFPRYVRVITEFMMLLVRNSSECVNIVSRYFTHLIASHESDEDRVELLLKTDNHKFLNRKNTQQRIITWHAY